MHYNKKEEIRNRNIGPDNTNVNMPDWFNVEMETLSTKLEKLNNQIASIPTDSSLKNLKVMMKETAKALQMRIDELDELTEIKSPTHKMTSPRKGGASKKD